jgi:hypothetical protein
LDPCAALHHQVVQDDVPRAATNVRSNGARWRRSKAPGSRKLRIVEHGSVERDGFQDFRENIQVGTLCTVNQQGNPFRTVSEWNPSYRPGSKIVRRSVKI